MNTPYCKIILHLGLMAGITALIAFCMAYPFLPGSYDGLAVGLSAMAQAFGIFGVLLVPVGVMWLAYEFRRQARKRQNLAVKGGGFAVAVVAAILASVVAAIVAVVGGASIGLSIGVLTLAAWLAVVLRLIPAIKSLRNLERERFNFTPLYLICLPIAALLFQLGLAAPLTQISRERAIAMSDDIIRAIEGYRTANGYYPSSLIATWADYSPGVVGIAQYHYAPQKGAYNLVFQQPRFLLDDLGVREFVVYNPLDEHTIISHAAWILLLSPQQVQATQGWYAVRDAPRPHWKYFWFD